MTGIFMLTVCLTQFLFLSLLKKQIFVFANAFTISTMDYRNIRKQTVLSQFILAMSLEVVAYAHAVGEETEAQSCQLVLVCQGGPPR